MEPAITDGWVYVEREFDGYVVLETDLYTQVWKESCLQTGWGHACPTGGTSSGWKPDYFTTDDDEVIYLVSG